MRPTNLAIVHDRGGVAVGFHVPIGEAGGLQDEIGHSREPYDIISISAAGALYAIWASTHVQSRFIVYLRPQRTSQWSRGSGRSGGLLARETRPTERGNNRRV
jgi:hypothetical protein